ncbi:MAG: hypothetical protein QOJ92_710 [Frankiales bacterium]|nr:hypothetical protein [Frankiales bacterium]
MSAKPAVSAATVPSPREAPNDAAPLDLMTELRLARDPQLEAFARVTRRDNQVLAALVTIMLVLYGFDLVLAITR